MRADQARRGTQVVGFGSPDPALPRDTERHVSAVTHRANTLLALSMPSHRDAPRLINEPSIAQVVVGICCGLRVDMAGGWTRWRLRSLAAIE